MQNLEQEKLRENKTKESGTLPVNDDVVSFIEKVPSQLNEAMSIFMDEHPNWDQYRLIQAAISGFLVQKGVSTREINRIYSQCMFCRKAFSKSI